MGDSSTPSSKAHKIWQPPTFDVFKAKRKGLLWYQIAGSFPKPISALVECD